RAPANHGQGNQLPSVVGSTCSLSFILSINPFSESSLINGVRTITSEKLAYPAPGMFVGIFDASLPSSDASPTPRITSTSGRRKTRHAIKLLKFERRVSVPVLLLNRSAEGRCVNTSRKTDAARPSWAMDDKACPTSLPPALSVSASSSTTSTQVPPSSSYRSGSSVSFLTPIASILS